MFNLKLPFQPTGDQPKAIRQLINNLDKDKLQVLLGVTGSGKTFTIANIIQKVQKPTLVIAHNKTLAAQLWSEFKEFFPDNAVHYFVSYYDYYQPEAYIAATDTYIEKDLDINEEIDRLRHAATHALLTRKDVIIVASVSCIYGLGSPELYKNSTFKLKTGQSIKRKELLNKLTDLHYERNDVDFKRGGIRVNGDTIDIFPAYEESFLRLDFDFDKLARVRELHPVNFDTKRELKDAEIFPAKHFVTEIKNMPNILKTIGHDLKQEHKRFSDEGKIVEAQRLKQRTNYDLEMLREVGFVKGVENYSRYFDQRKPGSPPNVLLDFFPEDYLLIVDESHMTFPQISGMHAGDRARKQSLIDNGFRLKAAYDNRPLNFGEFEKRMSTTIAVSATPGHYELAKADHIVEQLIRPTGLLDPEIEVRPTENQIDDLIVEIKKRTSEGQRVIVTTLTKRMSEDLTEFLIEAGIKVQYLHSDIITAERSEILADLRRGTFDVVVGINLLREGLDLPEVSLVAILDADKEGFLRSRQALIQTIGRAARHLNGRVIMYADHQTRSMQEAIRETNRRRIIQKKYNEKHNITPQSIQKKLGESGLRLSKEDEKASLANAKKMSKAKRMFLIEDLKEQMKVAAANLDFENAAKLRDRIHQLSVLK